MLKIFNDFKVNGGSFIMYYKNRIIIIFESFNKETFLDVIGRYELVPVGNADLLAEGEVNIWDYNEFILNLDFVPNIYKFIEELSDLGFEIKFEDIDTHEEITF